MSNNFQFLKKVDNNLFDIISDAEKLYKDEYFEQCMTQTRRFGEQICKNMMMQNNRPISSFDEMLATLKDQSHGNIQEKEFIDDLYFLKKNGNQAVHSGKVNQDAITALECLKCSFEAAISYCVYNQGASPDILKLNYDVELLITDKKSKKSLKEKYEEAKNSQNVQKQEYKQEKPVKNQSTRIYRNSFFKNLSFFWKMIIILSVISFSTVILLIISGFIANYH